MLLHQQEQQIRDRIDKLIEMRANDELTKEEFLEQKNRLLIKLAAYDNQLQDNSHSVKTWLELAEDFFNTALQARDTLRDGTIEEKRTLLLKIGENFILRDKKLTFSFKKPFDVLLIPEYHTNVLPDVSDLRTYFLETEEDYEPILV